MLVTFATISFVHSIFTGHRSVSTARFNIYGDEQDWTHTRPLKQSNFFKIGPNLIFFFFSNKLQLELVWTETFVLFLRSNWKMFSPLRISFSIYVPPLSPMTFRRVRHNLVVPSAWNCSVLREKETNSFSRCSKEHKFLLSRFRNERNTR